MEITRGDTRHYKFQRKDENGNVILKKADKIYFTVKNNEVEIKPLFQKTIDDMIFDSDGFYHFSILPEDTNKLPYRIYYYDIERIVEGDKRTISIGELKLTKEVTFAENEV